MVRCSVQTSHCIHDCGHASRQELLSWLVTCSGSHGHAYKAYALCCKLVTRMCSLQHWLEWHGYATRAVSVWLLHAWLPAICAQHAFQDASSTIASVPARYQCGALGCRKQIVEVQSHDYDKHSDSDAHFSNGE